MPLFFMASGALIAPRKDDLQKVLQRVVKVGVPLVLWSAIYLTWYWITAPNWMSVFRNRSETPILGGPVAIHFWFLYTIIGVYLIAPMLQAFYQNSDRKLIWLYVVMAFFGFSLVEPFRALMGYKLIGVDFTVFAWPVAYFLCGALLARIQIGSIGAFVCVAIFLLSGICTALATWLYSTRVAFHPNEAFYSYRFPFVAVGSVASFTALKWIGDQYFANSTIVKTISADTFAIYLVHLIFVYHITRNGFNIVEYPYFWSPLLFSFAALLPSVVIVRCLRRLPYSWVIAA